MIRLGLWAMAAALVLLGLSQGCTKRIPLETGQFDPRQKVVLTFADGSQMRGKIGTDESVELTTGGAVYRGSIWEVTEQEIVLRDARFVRRDSDGSAERARLTHARYDLGGEPAQFTFAVSEITQVEEVRMDALRSATQAVFWTVTGAVSAFLLAEKS